LPASPASSRLLFFYAPVLVLFARDAFILPVTSVFTRIHSGAVGKGGLQQRHRSRSTQWRQR
jgi:hypothetical protein